MLSRIQHKISGFNQAQSIFAGFAILTIISLLAAAIANEPLIAGIPAGLLLLYWVVLDFRKIWFLLLFLTPFSIEMSLPGGFGTDLPNEPLMIILTGIYLLFSLNNLQNQDTSFIKHPISAILLVHLGWIIVTTVTSSDFFTSLKWCLAKIWYIVPFFFLTGSLIKSNTDYKKLVWVIFIPLMFTVLLTIVRHGMVGFSFSEVNYVMKPFYRNHVNYASILVIFFPFVWFLRHNYKKFSFKWLTIVASLFILLVAIQLSFTRAAYVCLVIAAGTYFIVKYNLMRLVLAATTVGVITTVVFFASNNRFMDYSPEFKKTVTHQKFDNLLEATAKGEDVSTMERVYRWLAGYHMVLSKPVTGFGPGNFYNFYKEYQVTAFQTYVSDNEDKSTIHCYYLLMFVEQGFIGGFIFLALVLLVLLKAEKIYHQTIKPERQWIIMAAILSFVTVCALNLINDLTEADKVGPFFFIAMAVLINMDLLNKKDIIQTP